MVECDLRTQMLLYSAPVRSSKTSRYKTEDTKIFYGRVKNNSTENENYVLPTQSITNIQSWIFVVFITTNIVLVYPAVENNVELCHVDSPNMQPCITKKNANGKDIVWIRKISISDIG